MSPRRAAFVRNRRKPVTSCQANNAISAGSTRGERYQVRSVSITRLLASRLHKATAWLARCAARKITTMIAPVMACALLIQLAEAAGAVPTDADDAAKTSTATQPIAQTG